MHASVTLQLSEKEDDEKGMNKNMLAAVTLQGSQKAGDIGHIKLPLSFYEGIHFGISAWNPWGNASRSVRLLILTLNCSICCYRCI